MNYYISRAGQQYGPYSLADVQKYMAQGSISPGDFARTDTMNNWVPLSQLLAAAAAPSGPLPPPLQQPPAQPQWAGYQPQPQAQPQPQPAAYGQPAYPAAPMQAPQSPQAGGFVPPSLHWALVLVLGWVTCGIFLVVWLFIEASFIKKIRPASNVTMLLVVALVLPLLGYGAIVVSLMEQWPIGMTLGSLIVLAATVIAFVAIFKARSLLLEYYNTVEPINLRLSGVMTFFFGIFYFQYHFTRIAEWKRTGMLRPQG
jgi:hypothetical protein